MTAIENKVGRVKADVAQVKNELAGKCDRETVQEMIQNARPH